MWKLQVGNWREKRSHGMEQIPYGTIFLAGIFVGILVINLGRTMFVENSEFFDQETLYRMKYMTVDHNELFRYVLRKRLTWVVVLGILATTYLGMVVCIGTAFWYGLSAGAFLAVLTARYGLKGIFFALAGIFPQYLLYGPAMMMLLTWCEQVNKGIYFKGHRGGDYEKHLLPMRILRFVMVIGMIVIGCMLEGYCNPPILAGLLKIF